MNDAPNGHTPNLIGGAIRWLKHRFTDQETELAFLFGLRKTYSRIVRDRRIQMACGESGSPNRSSNRPGRQPA